MLGPPTSGPLQRPLLLATRVGAGTAAHMDPIQGGTTTAVGSEAASLGYICNPERDLLQEDDTTRDACRIDLTTTSSVRRPEPENGSIRRGALELLKNYGQALETKPLRTKCLTSAVMGGLGDVFAQGVLWARGGNALWVNTNVSDKQAHADRGDERNTQLPQCSNHVRAP